MDIKELTQAMNRFVSAKGWYSPGSPRPQTPRNLAISLNLEASEVLEHFQWQDKIQNSNDLAGELALGGGQQHAQLLLAGGAVEQPAPA